MEELPSQYDPKIVETRIYSEWMTRGFFESSPTLHPKGDQPLVENAERFTILLPPPNITGNLHMGHALNATISDILIRYHRMKGFKTTWLPGIDHAGIAAQLEHNALPARPGLQGPAHGGGAREAEDPEALVAGQPVIQGRLDREDAESAPRQVRLGDDAGEQKSRQRGLRRGLDDDGAAGRQRRLNLVGDKIQREIEGCDPQYGAHGKPAHDPDCR